MVEHAGLVIFAQWSHRWNHPFPDLQLAHTSSRLLRLISPWYIASYNKWKAEQEPRRFYEAWCDVISHIMLSKRRWKTYISLEEYTVKYFCVDKCILCAKKDYFMQYDAFIHLRVYKPDDDIQSTSDYYELVQPASTRKCGCKPNYFLFKCWIIEYAEKKGFKWWWDGFYLRINYNPDVDGYKLDNVERYILSRTGSKMIDKTHLRKKTRVKSTSLHKNAIYFK
jgi:hypothetical protein